MSYSTGRVKSLSESLGDIPKYGLFAHLGIFKQNFLSTSEVEYNGKNYKIPHYPLDSELTVGYTDRELQHKIVSLKTRAAILFEVAYATCISTGSVYAPSKTVDYNWYTESSTQPINIHTSSNRNTVESLTAYYKSLGYEGKIYGFSSPQAFVKLKEEGFVEVDTDVERYEKLSNGVVDVYNYRGVYTDESGNQKSYIEENFCIFFPQDLNIASAYFSPALTFSTVNTEALPLYVTVYDVVEYDTKESRVDIMAETNFICVLEKPEYVVHIKY